MKQSLSNVLKLVQFLLMHCLFWLVTFLLQRILFIFINSSKAIDVPPSELMSALLHGMVFDVSIAGYLSLLFCVIVAIGSQFVSISKLLHVCYTIAVILSSVITFLLPADGIIYGFWGFHYDATCIAASTTDAIEMWALVVYLIICIALVIGNNMLLHSMLVRIIKTKIVPPQNIVGKIVSALMMLVIGAAMIIPIRGGFGIAPLSNSRAYFSQYQFANHVAMNAVWNFLYSTKRLDSASAVYRYMDDADAEAIFSKLTHHTGEPVAILKTQRPNIIFILLESFSAHGIEYLGGENATPNIKALLKESVAFSNLMAASDRSGKGLVAAMCGYPVLPTFSIIQYPKKTQSLSFLPRKLREVGYNSQTFIYGGDLNFNNFNSLVNIAGFDHVITEDDFGAETRGPKWGTHDEYTFRRLLAEANQQPQPFFDFYFTLSSHEPFIVPMEKQLDDEYLNSMYYTDKCLGEFIANAKQQEWWSNTLVILMADHGHGGPQNVGVDDKKRFNIPLILTGGALACTDTIVAKKGTQIDLAVTLLNQLGIAADDFTFSKDLLNPTTTGYSFFDFNDGYGYVDDKNYQVYDNRGNVWLRLDTQAAEPDTLTGRAILQLMSNDNQRR